MQRISRAMMSLSSFATVRKKCDPGTEIQTQTAMSDHKTKLEKTSETILHRDRKKTAP